MTDLFFMLSKLFWVVANPGNFLILLLVVSMLMGWKRIAGFSALLMLILTFYPLGHLLLGPLEQRFERQSLPQEVAGIIVLGGAEDAELSAVWDMPQFNMAAERDMAILPLLEHYPDTPVVFTGGSGSLMKPDYRGADVTHQWLTSQQRGDAVIFERESRNTFENAIYSLEVLPEGSDIADPRGWLLVTSAFHMPRSVGVFRQQGWNVIPYSVDYYSKPFSLSAWNADLGSNLQELGIGTREWIGLLAYYLTEKTDALFPAETELQLVNE